MKSEIPNVIVRDDSDLTILSSAGRKKKVPRFVRDDSDLTILSSFHGRFHQKRQLEMILI